VETALATPVQLKAGNNYLVGVYENDLTYYWSDDLPAVFPFGTIIHTYYAYGDEFPIWSDDNSQWYFVDLRFSSVVSSGLPIAPTNSGSFVQGVWTGSVAVLQGASNVVLGADDGAGHAGESLQFDVAGTPRLAAGAVNNGIILSWPAGMGGFTLEQTPTLSPPAWSPVTLVPAVSAGRNTVTIMTTAPSMFYRLRK
jgi:hypothetical protein